MHDFYSPTPLRFAKRVAESPVTMAPSGLRLSERQALVALGVLFATELIATAVLLAFRREAYSAFDFNNGAADLLVLALLRVATLSIVARMLMRPPKTDGVGLVLLHAPASEPPHDSELAAEVSVDEARSRRQALTLFAFVACTVWQVRAHAPEFAPFPFCTLTLRLAPSTRTPGVRSPSGTCTYLPDAHPPSHRTAPHDHRRSSMRLRRNLYAGRHARPVRVMGVPGLQVYIGAKLACFEVRSLPSLPQLSARLCSCLLALRCPEAVPTFRIPTQAEPSLAT
jgi:hypothetical protein